MSPADVPDPVADELADAIGAAAPPTGPSTPTSPEALATWLAGRRWYAADGEPGDEPGPVTLTTVDLPVDPPLAVGLADVAPADTDTDTGERYQLLVAPTVADRPDVGDDPASAERLARFVAGGEQSVGGPAGTVTAHWLDPEAALGDAPARPLGSEQSNTSMVVGGTHVLKLFRRLRPGPHPEIEIGRHLAVTDDATPVPVAPLAGWYLLDPGGRRDGGTADGTEAGFTALGVVQELVPGALDAWGLVLSGLAGDPDGLLVRLRRLGADLATLHRALARPAPEPGPDPEAPEAFGSVPLVPSRIVDLVAGVARDAERVLTDGGHRSVDLADLDGRHGDVADRASGLAEQLGDDLGAAIRHHGDLHLGQVVLGSDGWVILDFEGEPQRPIAERRLRHSPLRDVAGMLRSFAYAAATHRRAHGHRLSAGWEPAARAAFLDGYLAAADPDLLPASATSTRTLLALLELEKVVYEVGYELAHRPDWVHLPAAGLRRLLDGTPS